MQLNPQLLMSGGLFMGDAMMRKKQQEEEMERMRMDMLRSGGIAGQRMFGSATAAAGMQGRHPGMGGPLGKEAALGMLNQALKQGGNMPYQKPEMGGMGKLAVLSLLGGLKQGGGGQAKVGPQTDTANTMSNDDQIAAAKAAGWNVDIDPNDMAYTDMVSPGDWGAFESGADMNPADRAAFDQETLRMANANGGNYTLADLGKNTAANDAVIAAANAKKKTAKSSNDTTMVEPVRNVVDNEPITGTWKAAIAPSSTTPVKATAGASSGDAMVDAAMSAGDVAKAGGAGAASGMIMGMNPATMAFAGVSAVGDAIMGADAADKQEEMIKSQMKEGRQQDLFAAIFNMGNKMSQRNAEFRQTMAQAWR